MEMDFRNMQGRDRRIKFRARDATRKEERERERDVEAAKKLGISFRETLASFPFNRRPHSRES